MAIFLKNVAFHGILLDALFEEGNQEWEEVSQLLKEGIMEGVVQPLKTTVFQRDQVEEAFRYMAQGKHIGKVLLEVSFTFVMRDNRLLTMDQPVMMKKKKTKKCNNFSVVLCLKDE